MAEGTKVVVLGRLEGSSRAAGTSFVKALQEL